MRATEPRLRIADGVAAVRAGQRLVLLNLDTLEANPVPVVLEGSAIFLWERLADGCGDQDEVTARARADFPEVDQSQLVGDIETFLNRLSRLGLIRESEGP